MPTPRGGGQVPYLALEGISGGLTNTGMLEASNGVHLYINGVTVGNAGGGTITASGASPARYNCCNNTTIQGGTLTNKPAPLWDSSGYTAILDGSTGAGAITINGTYTSGLEHVTYRPGDDQQQQQFPVECGVAASKPD